MLDKDLEEKPYNNENTSYEFTFKLICTLSLNPTI